MDTASTSTIGSEHLCMNMGRVVGDCTPVKVDEDIWTQVATHGPGNSKSGPSVANRSIIYRLHPSDGEPFLVVLNALWTCEKTTEPLTGLKALSEELETPIRYVLTPDSGHHLNLPVYAVALKEAKICIPAGRIERENPELMAMPNVETYPVDKPPAEITDAGLDILVWKGLIEGPANKKFQRMQMRFGYKLGSTEAQVFCHRPTGTITNGGHHMWFQASDGTPVFEMPGVMKFIMKLMGISLDYTRPGKLTTEPNGSYVVSDRAKVQASANEILGWKFDKMIDMHAGPNTHLKQGAHAVFEEVLGPIVKGDWDHLSWKPAAG